MRLVKKMSFVLASSLLSLAAVNAYSERTMEQVYKECGIGGALFGESSPTLAFISNVTWDLGTTAATSDSTGGCALGDNEKAAVFIHETYDQLSADIATGNGEYLNSLVGLMRCDTMASSDVKNQIRAQFSSIISNEQYSSLAAIEKSQALYGAVSPMLAQSGEKTCASS